MPEPELIEGEVVEQMTQALEAAPNPPPTLFRTDDPAEVIRRATAVAETLKDVLVKQGLVSRIKDREHVRVEGWTLCGTMLGVFPVCTWTKPVMDNSGPIGWEARVEARTLAGAIVGAAEAECLRSESTWKNRDDYALRSMAQTRATSKAMRQPLGFIVQLAGFDPTPAEEMPREAPGRRVEAPRPDAPPRSWTGKDGIQARLEAASDGPLNIWDIFMAYARACSYHLYGETDSKKLTAEQRSVLLQKAAGACVWLVENVAPVGIGTYFAPGDIQRAFAAVMDGTLLEAPDAPAEEYRETSSIPDEEAARIADETITGPPE